MALMDVYLTTQVYSYPLPSARLSGDLGLVWCGVPDGSALLRRVTTLRVVAGVLASATSFFLLSNFMVWASGGLYPHSVAGLASCYAAGIPFMAMIWSRPRSFLLCSSGFLRWQRR